MAEEFFPFTLYASDNGHYVRSPDAFRVLWLRTRPEGQSWYCYGVTIKSPTAVTFVIYDMADSARGGIGEIRATYDAVATPTLTKEAIEKRAMELARLRRDEELAQYETAIITGYAEELLRSIKEIA